MQRFIKIPLMFLFIGSALGVLLRWQFISPTPGVNYTFVLHGHSHVMFLGWVFNALFIGIVSKQICNERQRPFQNLFIVLQLLVTGMLVSFPLQGYGFFSILLSSLHTILAIVFIVKFFRETKSITSTSMWFARAAFLFFIVSAIGPFSLGYLMSAGLGHSKWYFFSIYFYLHFQYNGCFLFGVLSLFFNLLEKRHVNFNVAQARAAGRLLVGACIPAYVLSTLWAKPGYSYNIIGGIAALVQVVAFSILVSLLWKSRAEIHSTFSRVSRYALSVVLLCFAVKILLQFVSALPVAARMAYELRPVTIAYLHLVLVGVISLFLITWYLESNLVSERYAKYGINLFVVAFIGMEICIVLYPWWTKIAGTFLPPVATLTFVFSALLSLSYLIVLVAPYPKTDESHALS